MRKVLFFMGLIGIVFNSCDPYDDFTKDFENTTVYFGTQKPLRTVVAYEEMEFKIGVVIGGKRENNDGEFAEFVIDETLLTTIDGADAFTLLPKDYYSLSNDNTMIIPKGKFIGDITVTLNRDSFTNDPLSIGNNYALPLRITNSSLDFIGGFQIGSNTAKEDPQDYTILVIKYISPFSGTFYHKGVQRELDVNGIVINEVVYDNSDLVSNETWNLITEDRNSIRTTAIGAISGQNFVINVNESDNNTVTIDSPSGGITNLVGSGSFDMASGTYYLNYSFTYQGTNYQVTDTLIARTRPEEDLRFEEW